MIALTLNLGPQGPRRSAPHSPLRERGQQAEGDLVRRAPDDPEAFAALYRRHYPAIQRYLRRRLGDAHLVEDAVAETFLDALRQIGRYTDRGLPFRSWLYRIASGQAARQLRQAARIAMAQLDEEPAQEGEVQEPGAAVARAALLQIAARYQTVLALHYFEEQSIEEIARTLGCREGTVKSRLARGREALRQQLERMGVNS